MTGTQPPPAQAVKSGSPRGLSNGWIIGSLVAAIVVSIPITLIMAFVAVMGCDGTAEQCARTSSGASGWFLGTFALVTVVGVIALFVVGIMASRETKRGRVWRLIAAIGILCMPLVGVLLAFVTLSFTLH